MTSSKAPLPRETEIALAVRSQRPEAVLRRVAALESIGVLELVPRPPHRLRDRYVDTAGGDLGSHGYALRVREVDGEPLVTLKGETERIASGADRLELELPWSPEAGRRVLAELHARGLPVGTEIGGGAPLDALAEAGLGLIQERETHRNVRSVVDAGTELAELDIDAVTYRFPRGAGRLYEVEIEARSDEASIGNIARALRRSFPELVEWPYPKLVTGAALERALASGAIILGPDRAVVADTLDRLAAALAQNG